ncbi:allergen Ale o 13 [Metarhizium album ARSEF 1941]|uniref:Allergen Ale o 13 n=1 Tax=Metarhizium album (strain ARSEF 1941) TaxID=1081103 RepID=A0A0B2WLE1_METAS|nr:allergen Ale o 13 [Metarhizium album ARSEF 1941]KHN94282.1 allergen Ale o 13 [Metarhizium album ARSEF 1941]
MTDVFSGRYKLSESTNFDEFLTELGRSVMIASQANVIVRIVTYSNLGVGRGKHQLDKSASPEIEIQRNGDEWHVRSTAGPESSDFSFKLGKEFEEMRQDQAKVRSVVIQDGNKWTQTQTPIDGTKIVTIVREFKDAEMTTSATVGSVTSVRHFDRIG